MSAQKRGAQRPQQQYHPSNYPQHYAHDLNHIQFPSAPWQAAPSHQPHPTQLYYQNQQYPPADPYALTNNTHAFASSSAYPQHLQYQTTPYHPHSHPYASPHSVGFQDSSASTRGGYLAADHALSGGLSPSHLSSGSLSSSQSPKPSAGRSRLNNFVFPNQGGSASLESQVAHLNLEAPAASLATNASSTAATLRTPSFAHQAAELSADSTPLVASSEPRSGISLRYPPLPHVPEPPATPSLLLAGGEQLSARQGEPQDAAKSDASIDQSVQDYVSALRSIVDVYRQRDEILRLRTEAVGFQPRQAWLVWEKHKSTDASTLNGPDQDETAQQSAVSADADDTATANPVLGVRLLQRVDQLQRENDELGRLLASGARVNSHVTIASADRKAQSTEVEELRREVQDCHRLIEAMDQALEKAEARAVASERALEVACRTNSTAILPTKQATVQVKDLAESSTGAGAEDVKKPSSSSKNSSSTRKGSKAANTPLNNANGGGAGKSGAQQRSRSHNAAKGDAKSNNNANAGNVKTTRSDTPKSPSGAKTTKTIKTTKTQAASAPKGR